MMPILRADLQVHSSHAEASATLPLAGATSPLPFTPRAVAMVNQAREGRQVTRAKAQLADGSPSRSAVQMEARL